jgi:hypothetical protein
VCVILSNVPIHKFGLARRPTGREHNVVACLGENPVSIRRHVAPQVARSEHRPAWALSVEGSISTRAITNVGKAIGDKRIALHVRQ